eukprot:9483803-Pyramimonas_sp.AAC.1
MDPTLRWQETKPLRRKPAKEKCNPRSSSAAGRPPRRGCLCTSAPLARRCSCPLFASGPSQACAP